MFVLVCTSTDSYQVAGIFDDLAALERAEVRLCAKYTEKYGPQGEGWHYQILPLLDETLQTVLTIVEMGWLKSYGFQVVHP